MSARGANRIVARSTIVVLSVAALGLSGCSSTSGGSDGTLSGGSDPLSGPSESGTSGATSAASIAFNVKNHAESVGVDTPVTVTAKNGTLSAVTVKVGAGHETLDGALSSDDTSWTARDLLEPGKAYHVRATAVSSDGAEVTRKASFRSQDLTLDEQTFPSIAPLQGETVGVGMPVIIQFDVPVTNRASIERHLSVTSSPKVVGSWHWISDNEVHWRPKRFWPSRTRVTVHADINSVPAGNGIYGQEDRSASFVIGNSVIDKINIRTDEMQVWVNDKLVRTIPITGGKPGWETRSGTKLIIEKIAKKRMDAATVGIQPDDPEYYNIPDVRFAMRVTYSGEFLHAAPWSVSDQGVDNVSHGCVGMNTANAKWLFGISHRGDPVRVKGTSRSLEPGNGWTDWDMSFKQYKAGSALQ
jgi:lipoprotein-anchoring transpeptidase ErfK/SrfK